MAPPSTASEPYTLHLEHSNHSLGHITGLTYSSQSAGALCRYFGGIPYALPPIGPYRFRRPRSLPACYRYGTKANPGVFNGGAGICPQPGYMRPMNPESWDEDCLQLNIWVPAGKAPEEGWPVFFFIHGGWLQHGTPNSNNLISMLGKTAGQCIVVMPAYRLNVFGFIASRELEEESGTVGNYGFWDQRLALEWTRRRIAYFGGDPTNITVGGYSAGAHSTFHQLSHDLSLPRPHRIIRRAILYSNGPGMQPKPLSAAQTQFDSLLTALRIPLTLSAPDKLQRLRALPAADLVAAAGEVELHEFRATTDGAFVRKELFDEIDDGTFAARLREGKVEILTGECRDEHFVYGSWRPPKEDTYAAFRTRLCADYAPRTVDAVLEGVYCPDGELPTVEGTKCKDWRDAFGRVFAQLQVHALERGFIARLAQHGAGDLVKRYRIEWRAECVDGVLPKEWGVTHTTDMALWFWGNGMGGKKGGPVGLTVQEEKTAERWLEPFWGWLRGEGLNGWGTSGPKEVRRLRSDGSIDVWKDERWDAGIKVWELVRTAQKEMEDSRGAKL